jgi:CRP-like cAMP-binding protein
MAKQIEVNPEARLESRPSDVKINLDQYLEISLFDQLKNKIKENKWPGAMVVRRYRKGEVVCRQGEPGWTAFYILTTEDQYKFGLSQLRAAGSSAERGEINSEITMIGQRLSLLRTGGDVDQLRTAATVHLSIAKQNRRPGGGFLAGLFGGRKVEPRATPRSIPIDGPTEIDYGTLTAVMREGELFGEMSCLYRTPRSATVIAARDCYMLEMLRNILDKVQKDPAYKDVMDKKYRERVFQLHVRKLSIFSDLTEEQYEAIKNNLDLVTFESGQVICDENDRSDCLYIVRSGLIKVLKKTSALLSRENVRNWPALVKAILEGEAQPTTPKGKLWALLPQATKDVVKAAGDASQLTDAQKLEILYGLNDVIKKPQFLETKEVGTLLTAELKERVQGPDNAKPLGAKPSTWSDQDLRLGGRLVLEGLFGTALRSFRRRVGPECVLSYCARGDIIGEVGVLEQSPRTATCLAFGHPLDAKSKDSGRVELVRIPGQLFLQIMAASPAIRQKVESKLAERRRLTEERARQGVTDEPSDVQLSERFQSLGLIQGQRLMLIDLDRCTRCDECVKACVNTHDDGKSRLFLDGPRFENFLVPVTCRSCLDPVCMIGCPVGSIHRGDNGQIVIEDWCIGCGLCARNCPYGSIHMHDIGIVTDNARGWKYTASALAGDRWVQPRYNDSSWAIGQGPFEYDREFQTHLAAHLKQASKKPVAKEGPLCFRFEFLLSGDLLRADSQFKVELTSVDPSARLFVNGVELRPEKEANKKGERAYWMPQEPPAGGNGAPKPINPLRSGRNVLGVWVTPNPNKTDVALLKARLDAIQKPQIESPDPAAFTQKQVTEKAVVCDLCSSSFGKVPACVNACPHDAAMRVDARFEFPVS